MPKNCALHKALVSAEWMLHKQERVMPETNYRLFKELDRISFHLEGQQSSHLSLSKSFCGDQPGSQLSAVMCMHSTGHS